jgi:LmbE family N-acetylglucosaminyl deacetylase
LSFGEGAPRLYTAAASFPEHPKPRLSNKDDPADLVLDVSAALEQKQQAALCHRTQHALFVRRASKEAGRQLTVPEVIVKVESLHRAYPPIEEGRLSDDPIAELLKPWSTDASNAGQQ